MTLFRSKVENEQKLYYGNASARAAGYNMSLEDLESSTWGNSSTSESEEALSRSQHAHSSSVGQGSSIPEDSAARELLADGSVAKEGLLKRVLDAHREKGSEAADDAWFDYLNRDQNDDDHVTRLGDPDTSSVTLSSDDSKGDGKGPHKGTHSKRSAASSSDTSEGSTDA